MIRPREVKERLRPSFDPFVIVELCPVVSRHGLEGRVVLPDEVDHPTVQRSSRPVPQLPDQQQPTLTLDEADDAVFAARARHRIDLPVPRLLPSLDLRGALGDGAFTGQFPATIIAAVAFTPTLAGSPEVCVEESSLALVAPDVAVDGLVADREQAFAGEVARDLLGAPLPAQQPVDEREVRGREALVAAGAGAAPVGPLLGLARAVVAVPAGAVAAELAADGRAVAAEGAGHLGLRQALHSQGGEHIPLVGGELAVRHGEYPLPGS